jgi:hypothetical protein
MCKKNTIAVMILLFAVGAVAAYQLWDKRGNKDLVEARHFAASYERETDEKDRCASSDLAAMYYRRGGEAAEFEAWKAKAQQHCPADFSYAYHLVRSP